MNEEQWRVIGEWSNYAVSSHGRIKRLTTRNSGVAGRVLATFLVCGYPSVNLSRPGKRQSVRIHRIVADAFFDRPAGASEVNHIDADRANNHVSNLEWVSASGNRLHAYRTGGLSAVGERNGYSKLTEYAVREIRELSRSEQSLAEKHQVSVRTIRDVRARRTWAHI
ncbi:HNH endonuclease [Burkholderia gladioli]|uniref:HNH endonuclease n=1 Tax=Burkholderia gladioli TaxID=28095 RepID=UPI001641DA1A|nr:HNH endonuclease [Burkholderia gladioli]